MFDRMTPESKDLFVLARLEASATKCLSQTDIRPEHCLLGLLRQADTPIGDLLLRHGLDLAAVRESLRRQ